MRNADSIDVVLVVCPRCRTSGNGGVLGRVVRNHDGKHRFVAWVPASSADGHRFSDDELLPSAEFVTFDFEDTTAGGLRSVDVECRHGRRSLPRARVEREMASHRQGKPARILVSHPPAR
jgi:hypothetical protein